MSDSGQMRRGRVTRRRWQSLSPAQRSARVLLAGAHSGTSTLLAAQMLELGFALRDMHAAAGEAQRAAELERTALHALQSVIKDADRDPHDNAPLQLGTALRHGSTIERREHPQDNGEIER